MRFWRKFEEIKNVGKEKTFVPIKLFAKNKDFFETKLCQVAWKFAKFLRLSKIVKTAFWFQGSPPAEDYRSLS